MYLCPTHLNLVSKRGRFVKTIVTMKIINQLTDLKGSQPDPFIISDNGKFYIYCTGYDGVYCYISDTLDNFNYYGKVLSVEGQKEYWAPCVVKIDGNFYMYYSSMPCDSDDVHTQAIKVAVSGRPEGPFEYVKDLLPPFSIDADVKVNDSGIYMFYSVNRYEGERVGTYIKVDKMSDPYTLEGNPIDVVVPTLDEEIFQKDRFVKGQHWHTIEGASYFFRDGYHYCLFSGNCYEKDTYYIGYSVAHSDEMQLNKLNFKKYPDDNTYAPLIKSNDYEYGTGHNSVIDVDGQLYVVYHGRDEVKTSHMDTRTARICKLFADNGVLRVERYK